MPIMYFFECENCGAKSDPLNSGNTPAGWLSLNTMPTPGDTTASPTKYFDKIECLAAYSQKVAKDAGA